MKRILKYFFVFVAVIFNFNTVCAATDMNFDIKIDDNGIINADTDRANSVTYGLSGYGGLNTRVTAQGLLNTILQIILGFAGLISLGFVIYGGINITFNAKGDKNIYGKNLKIMITGGIAFLIVLLSYAITQFVLTYLGFITS